MCTLTLKLSAWGKLVAGSLLSGSKRCQRPRDAHFLLSQGAHSAAITLFWLRFERFRLSDFKTDVHTWNYYSSVFK